MFDDGKVRFQTRAEQAQTDEAAVSYQRLVLCALRDVYTALVSYSRAAQRGRKLAAEVGADRQAVDIATRRYREGLESFRSVLDAERSRYVVDDNLAQSDRNTAPALVALYKALGGGWQIVSEAANTSAKKD